jgi:hypothetical protein
MAVRFHFAESLMPLIRQAFLDVSQYQFIETGRKGHEVFNVMNTKVTHSHRFTNIQVMYTSRSPILEDEVKIWVDHLVTLLPKGVEVLSYTIMQAKHAQHDASVIIRFSQAFAVQQAA